MTAVHTHSHISLTAQRMLLALVATFVLMLAEVLAGLLSNSLALLTDAAHNLTDIVALALSWYALRITTRPANAGKTFGYHRVGILVALANAMGLVGIALSIFYEAYQRLVSPPTVEEHILIAVATVATLVNMGTALLVHRGSEHDLNVRSAFVHLASDAIATFGALLAGIGIALTRWDGLDALASIIIGLLILWSGWSIVRETVDILLESTPSDVDMSAMVRDLMRVQGVRGLHDLHVWSLSRNMRALSVHVLTDDVSISAGAEIQRAINELLGSKYGISHTTLQLECAGCEPDLLYCDLNVPFNHQMLSQGGHQH